jgi:hypothetical protein
MEKEKILDLSILTSITLYLQSAEAVYPIIFLLDTPQMVKRAHITDISYYAALKTGLNITEVMSIAILSGVHGNGEGCGSQNYFIAVKAPLRSLMARRMIRNP